jgi:hypothetical protein
MTPAERLQQALKERRGDVAPITGQPSVIGYGSSAGSLIARLKAELRSANARAKMLEKEAAKLRIELSAALAKLKEKDRQP